MYFFFEDRTKIVLFTDKTDKYDFLGSLYRVQAPYCWNSIKKNRIFMDFDLRCRFNEFNYKPFLPLSGTFQGILFFRKIIKENKCSQIEK